MWKRLGLRMEILGLELACLLSCTQRFKQAAWRRSKIPALPSEQRRRAGARAVQWVHAQAADAAGAHAGGIVCSQCWALGVAERQALWPRVVERCGVHIARQSLSKHRTITAHLSEGESALTQVDTLTFNRTETHWLNWLNYCTLKVQ